MGGARHWREKDARTPEEHMAPHDTNTPKEAKRHAFPLVGMGVLLAIVIIGFLWWVANALQGPDETEANPVEAPAQAPAAAPAEPAAPQRAGKPSGSPWPRPAAAIPSAPCQTISLSPTPLSEALIRDPDGGCRGSSPSWRASATARRGCPWDIEQDFDSIAPYTIEEAYEVADAIARKDMAALRDELGDLLFQVVYHARMAEEEGAFAFADVVRAIADKMVRRHPHVFGDESRDKTADQQTVDWERLKAAERGAGRRARRRRRRAAGADPRGQAPEPRRPRRLRLAGRRRGARQDRRGDGRARRGARRRRRSAGCARSTATSCS